jgi:glycosyltransferase involved in cell wall biosynthesis
MAGLPVVATPVGVVLDLEQDHGLSLTTVPVHPSPIQLAAAVRQAISPANRVVVQRALTVSLNHYSAKTMAQRWAAYLQSIARQQSMI